MAEMTRAQSAKLAIFDHATRAGATSKRVVEALKKEGFTLAEISAAVEAWGTPPPTTRSNKEGV